MRVCRISSKNEKNRRKVTTVKNNFFITPSYMFVDELLISVKAGLPGDEIISTLINEIREGTTN